MGNAFHDWDECQDQKREVWCDTEMKSFIHVVKIATWADVVEVRKFKRFIFNLKAGNIEEIFSPQRMV
jgi:hypothetical protein